METPKEDTPRGASQEDEVSIPHPSCSYCRKLNHTEENCWKRMEECLRCGGANHWVANCPIVLREGRKTQQPPNTNPGQTEEKGAGSKEPARVYSLERLQGSDSSKDVEGTVRCLTQILIDSVKRKISRMKFFKGERV